MTGKKRRDWPTIIRQIKAGYGIAKKRKLTSYKLGVMVFDTDQRTVDAWEGGRSEPVDHKATRLLELHGEFHRESHVTLHDEVKQTLQT